MFNISQINNKTVWVFRDPRSGSSWFINALERRLFRSKLFFDLENPNIFSTTNVYIEPDSQEKKQRISEFFDQRIQSSQDIRRILNTHEYVALESIKKYNDPIIFRNVRKNKTKQFISLVIAGRTNTYNIHNKDRLKDLPKLEPTTVSMESLQCFIDRIHEAERLWKLYSYNYMHETVYYEDLLQGWESKLIPLKLKMDPSGEGRTTIKLPYIHEEVVTNYKEVDDIINEQLGMYK